MRVLSTNEGSTKRSFKITMELEKVEIEFPTSFQIDSAHTIGRLYNPSTNIMISLQA